MTIEPNELVEVKQADRDAAADFGRHVGRLTPRDADNMRAGDWDATGDVQFFARHRIAANPNPPQGREQAIWALAEAMYDDRPAKVISEALADATKLPLDAAIPLDAFLETGGDHAPLVRLATIAFDFLTSPAMSPTNGLREAAFVLGPVWREAEEEDECWTAEVQVVGGHYVVATVHGASKAEATARARAILAALDTTGAEGGPVSDATLRMAKTLGAEFVRKPALVPHSAEREAIIDALAFARSSTIEDDALVLRVAEAITKELARQDGNDSTWPLQDGKLPWLDQGEVDMLSVARAALDAAAPKAVEREGR